VSVIRVERDAAHARVVLDRPDVRNAFNAEMIAALNDAFASLGHDASVRTIELRGDGPAFSAGADLGWMRSSLDLSEDENVADATAMAQMFRTIDRCPKPVIARVHRAAIAGGCGLCAVSDIVVAADDAVFPAVISPFVIAKIGVSHARALFLTAQRFDAQRALRIGLVHEVVAEAELDARVAALRDELATCGPNAVAQAKRLVAEVPRLDADGATALTTHAIASARTSEEGQEGLRAFLERRAPVWPPG
jgi:methylglutaconyl-CoA hydratase